ncbi:heterokaryon incompatibility protein [Fusarium flagelliforme]|uniref:Heterokaryon incompatibility protein n=1 Tax=Fusarium flagelliforme TaxID=2675880 RepID=A0A395MPD6_9HYPO|nr:heterokaryon incompatibility protein [Fusarium flagelliforme]
MSLLQSLSYNKLPPEHIRLLRINTDELDANVGFLEIVSLDKAPPFYALSHCWGTQAQDTTIQIDGQTIDLTPGLVAGIKALQKLAGDESSFKPPLRHVWIDSICVNQQSIADRSSQVALMRRIYSKSLTTLIWLGPERAWTPSALELIDQIYDIVLSDYPTARIEGDIPVKTYSDSLHSLTGLPSWDAECWTHLQQMMDLDWFSRIWVIQEVVLSPLDPIVICGRHLYPWCKLQWASSWLRRIGYMRLPQIPQTLLNVSNMGNLRYCRSKWPLEALMSFTMTKFHATDQRDKIFGLLGIAAECADPAKTPDALRPDYSTSLVQTYLKIARFLLKNGSSLAILTRAHGATGCLMRKQRVHNFEDLPSWTPDWSDFRVFNKSIRTSLARAHYSDPDAPPRLGFAKSYAASAGLSRKLYESEDIAILRVGGVKLATVTHLYCFDENEPSKDEFQHTIDAKLRAAWNLGLSTLEIRDLTSWATTFIRATTAERYDLTKRSLEQSIKDGMAYLVQKLEDEESGLAFSTVAEERPRAIEGLRALSVGGEIREYITLAYTYCFSRSFVVTSTGNIGIGPSDTKIGDYAVVILGSDVPYVLRDNGSSCSFVGELYLEGYMNGEVAMAMEQRLIKEEVMDIR